MLKIQEIREIIKLVDQSTIDEFSFEHEGSKVELKKFKQPSTESAVAVQTIEPLKQAAPAPQAIQQAPAQAPVQEPTPAEAPAPAASETQEDANLHKVTSPMVGTFYQSPSPEAGPYVKVGSKIEEDSVICIVEAMKLFNEIEAEVKGEIVEILVKDGQLVEYGQPLFLVKPE
ncbi:acetyl-CoA carboxylase biotin carboxyl carrier protein [Bacillus seohaeanensis]|uniref:Biotin carboxyl carrier protein of acetyl-CoA carboxylase n=1 Tax=Bacillus seohaeanensis TaxID=284580 RepID=A0ABW5RUD0_9BACI